MKGIIVIILLIAMYYAFKKDIEDRITDAYKKGYNDGLYQNVVRICSDKEAE